MSKKGGVVLIKDAPWRETSPSNKPIPKIHLSPLLTIPKDPFSNYALSVMKHPNPIGSGLGSEAIVEAAGPDCIIPGQITPIRLLGLKVWPINVDLKFLDPVGRELQHIGKFMDSAVNLMDKALVDLVPPCDFKYKKASTAIGFIATVTELFELVAMQEQKMRKGPWFEEEDKRLTAVVSLLGERRWDALANASGLSRSGKSCRLRWMNYLRPNLKHGRISEEEEKIIVQLHQQWGNKWSRIARRLPGRTDNEIKNYWRSYLRRECQAQGHEKIKQKLTVRNCEGVDQSISRRDCILEKDEISESSFESSDAFQPSNYAIMHSPYEKRVSDWITGWSNNEKGDGVKHSLDYCSVDSCYCYMTNMNGENETNLWDCSSSIWNMEYS